jgi:hypothetical protein
MAMRLARLCEIGCMITWQTSPILAPWREGGRLGRGTYKTRRPGNQEGGVDEYLCGEPVL